MTETTQIRQHAWAKLGTRVDVTTASEALASSGLAGWNLRKAEIFAAEDDGELVKVPGRAAILRGDPGSEARVLGDVGAGYQIIQNEDYCELLDAIADQGATFEYAGSFDMDRKVFITMRLGDWSVGGDQMVDYVTAVGAHDGSMSLNLLTSPIRTDCENVLNLAFQKRTGLIRVRHTSGVRGMSWADARRALQESTRYLQDARRVAERLARKKMTSATFRQVVMDAYGPDLDAAVPTITRTMAKVEQMVDLFENSPTTESIRGTAWGGLNAITEWYDHMSPTRGPDPERSRAAKALLDPGFKNDALRLMMDA